MDSVMKMRNRRGAFYRNRRSRPVPHLTAAQARLHGGIARARTEFALAAIEARYARIEFDVVAGTIEFGRTLKPSFPSDPFGPPEGW